MSPVQEPQQIILVVVNYGTSLYSIGHSSDSPLAAADSGHGVVVACDRNPTPTVVSVARERTEEYFFKRSVVQIEIFPRMRWCGVSEVP